MQKKRIRESTMLGVGAAVALFGASSTARAGVCPFGSKLSTYFPGKANDGCTVLDKTISAVSANINVDAASTGVQPQTVVNDPGLLFGPSGGVNVPSAITFTITAPSTDPMTDASLSLDFLSGLSVQATEMLSNGKSLSASDSTPNPPPRDLRPNDGPHGDRFVDDL